MPGKPDESLLITAIRYTDESLQMPPNGRLPATVVADFEQWVKMGAPDPRRNGGEDGARSTSTNCGDSGRPAAEAGEAAAGQGRGLAKDRNRPLLARGHEAKAQARGRFRSSYVDPSGHFDLIGCRSTGRSRGLLGRHIGGRFPPACSASCGRRRRAASVRRSGPSARAGGRRAATRAPFASASATCSSITSTCRAGRDRSDIDGYPGPSGGPVRSARMRLLSIFATSSSWIAACA